MKPRVTPRLSRLLGEYERLTRNEGAALRAQDFSTLAELNALKAALLGQITKEGSVLGLDRGTQWFDDCLIALAALERDNVSFASRILVQLTVQRESLSAARKRLRGLGNAYRTRSSSSSSQLFALS